MTDSDSEWIPFNRPFIVGQELFYIAQAVLEGQLAGGGRFTELCTQWLEREFGAKKTLLTHSCTAALEMCALLADIEPGDEVIMPSYTFVSTANAFALRGARIRFIDIREDTLNLDETLIEAAITPRTKAIVPVHYAGVSAEMDAIMAIAEQHCLSVVEDAAQGVNAKYRGRYLGTIGDLGAYSFHETKNFIAGEGGALVVNRQDMIDRAEILLEKGTDRRHFQRGERSKYTWVDYGSSFLPSELIAAFLYAQLEAAPRITRTRMAIHERYMHAFADLDRRGMVQMLRNPPHCEHNGHLFYLIVRSNALRDELIAHLRSRKIGAVFHYVPLHSSPMGQRIASQVANLPKTDDLSARLVRLPCYFGLERLAQDRVVDEVRRFLLAHT